MRNDIIIQKRKYGRILFSEAQIKTLLHHCFTVLKYLRGLDRLDNFSAMFTRQTTFVNFLCAFLHNYPSERDMRCFSLREFDPHLPDYYYIKVGYVGYCVSICFWWLSKHMFLMTETIKLCPDANKMMLCYAISWVILIRQLTRNPHTKFFNIKHNEVAQNRFQNLYLHKKLIKLHVLNGFLC